MRNSLLTLLSLSVVAVLLWRATGRVLSLNRAQETLSHLIVSLSDEEPQQLEISYQRSREGSFDTIRQFLSVAQKIEISQALLAQGQYDQVTHIIDSLDTHSLSDVQKLEVAELMMAIEYNKNDILLLSDTISIQALSVEQKTSLSQLMVEFGQLNSALAIVESSDLPVAHEIAVAKRAAEAGQIDRALVIIASHPATLSDEYYFSGEPADSGKVLALAEIALQLASMERIERARGLLQEAYGRVEELPTGYMSNGSCENARASVLRAIAKGFAAIDALEETRNTAMDLYTCSPAVSYHSPASDQAELFDEILDSLETFEQVMRLLPTHWQEDGLSTDGAATNAVFAIRLAELDVSDMAIKVAENADYADVDNQLHGFPEKDLWFQLAEAFKRQGDTVAAAYAQEQYELFKAKEASSGFLGGDTP